MFNGLKLNTMKHLKGEAKKRHLSVRDSPYNINVTFNGMTIMSREFRIVSSFSQLPKEQQVMRTARQSTN